MQRFYHFHLESVTPAEIDLATICRALGPFVCLRMFVLAPVLFADIALFLAR